MDGERDQGTQGAVLLSRRRLSCILSFWHGDDDTGVASADETGGSGSAGEIDGGVGSRGFYAQGEVEGRGEGG